jgi:hypothetical protein
MQKKRGWSMSDPFGLHSMEEAQVIDMPGCKGKQFRNPPTRVAILTEAPGGLQNPLHSAPLPGIGNRPGIIKRHLLAIAGYQQRLEVEGVDLARPPLHKQENDPLSPGSVMSPALGCPGRTASVLRGQNLGHEGSKPTGRVPQPGSS